MKSFTRQQAIPRFVLRGISMKRIWPDYLHIVDLALAPEAAASDPWLHYFVVQPQINKHQKA